MRLWIRLVSLALITLALVRPVHADDDARVREEARKAFAAGQEADRKGDYRTAIEFYLRAYELKPHHFALYNIGTDYERLGEYREAAAWFQRYLQEAPSSPEIDKVQRIIVELKLRPSKLTVTTNVPGVRVFVDGQYSGSTPFAKPVKGGGRRIAVELNGQRDERDVYLEYGEPKEIEFSMRTVAPPTGPRGTLQITGTPDGASVAIDDEVVGSLPSTTVEVTPGQHRIKITRFGYQPFETTATVAVDQVTPVRALMVRDGELAPGTKALTAGYLIGIGGGADVRGNGSLFLVDFGVRYNKYDLSWRYGKATGVYTFDFLFRAALLDTKIAPFVGGGIAYLGSEDSTSGGSAGLELVGGLRYDLARSLTGTATLIVETGVRLHKDVTSGDPPMTRSGIVIPVLASIQYTYGRGR